MASLTLKDIPKDLHRQLRVRAERNRRSLSQEALACLELAVAGAPPDAGHTLSRARALRAGVKPIAAADVHRWIDQGRS